MTAALTEAYYRRLYAFHDPSPVIPLEEFFNPNHSPDDGKFTSGSRGRKIKGTTSGGKVWTGMSAHPENRVKPKSKVHFPLEPDDYESKDEARVRFATSVYDADLGNGYQARVAGVREIHNGIAVTIIIRKGHEQAAISTRELAIDGAGKLVAHHETLYVEPKHQGKGIADRFNSHAVAEYQKLGVDRIDLHAGSTVGGYAWARQGFRMFEGDRKKFLGAQLDRLDAQMKHPAPVLRPHAKKIKAEVAALRKALEAGEDVQPIHLAAIGEKYARFTARDDFKNEYPTWPGKNLLIGTVWLGVYYFDANRKVTAAAVDLEHAALRNEQFYNQNHDPKDGRFSSGRSSIRKGWEDDYRAKQWQYEPSARGVQRMTRSEQAAEQKADFLKRHPKATEAVYDEIFGPHDEDGAIVYRTHTKQGIRVDVVDKSAEGHPDRLDEITRFTADMVEQFPHHDYDHVQITVSKELMTEGGEAGVTGGVAVYNSITIAPATVNNTFGFHDLVHAAVRANIIGKSAEYVIAHEYGHSLDYDAARPGGIGRRSDNLTINPAASKYAKTNKREYWAEAFAENWMSHLQHEGVPKWVTEAVKNGNEYGGPYKAQEGITASLFVEALACHDAACAPPPAGTGGSRPTGALQARRGVVPGYGATARRDIHLAGVRVTYKPDYPDDHPDPGEVVWAKVRYQEDVNQSKDRPVLIIGRINGTDKLAAVQLTSNDRPGKDRLNVGPGSWDRLHRNSAVKLDQIIIIDPRDYRREGSTFDREKFEEVIGRLAAYHRTPVQIAAGGTWVELYNHEHDKRDGRFTSGGGSFRPITKAEARGDSRPVGAEEFQRLAETGRSQLEGYARNAKKINLTDEQWSQVKSGAYAEARKSWGGATINLHTGEPLPQGVNAWAITVKSTKGKRTQNSISVHENATEEEFNAAMDHALKRFGYTLARESHYLGVFHDDANHRIDIDPVLVVHRHADVETIGAATYAIGGAYNFKDGNGYWPPHIDTSPTATNKHDDIVRSLYD